MSKGQEHFEWVCKQPCEKTAVASLSLGEFRKLGGWLARRGEISGIPGRVWGVVLADGFLRIMAGKLGKEQQDAEKVKEALG